MSQTNFNPHLEPDLAHVEALLKSLRPGAPRLSRDHLMFHAGRLSAPAVPWPGRAWFWPGATGAMTLLTISLTALLAIRPSPHMTERIVYVPSAAPSTPPTPTIGPAIPTSRTHSDYPEPPPTQAAYLALRNQVLARGLDAFPDFSTEPTNRIGAMPESLDDVFGPTGRNWRRLRSIELNSLLNPGERS